MVPGVSNSVGLYVPLLKINPRKNDSSGNNLRGRKRSHGAISRSSVSDTAAKALQEALEPITIHLSGAARAAGQAEGKLMHAVASFGWKWAIVAGGAATGGIMAVQLAALLTAEWQRHH